MIVEATPYVAVQTRFIPATATKPGRICVETLGAYPFRKYYSAQGENAHLAAAEAFLAELRWNGAGVTWHVGGTATGFVLVSERAV